MALKKYRALRETMISHECRRVKEGDVFEADFPENMKLSDNLELVVELPESVPAKTKTKAAAPSA